MILVSSRGLILYAGHSHHAATRVRYGVCSTCIYLTEGEREREIMARVYMGRTIESPLLHMEKKTIENKIIKREIEGGNYNKTAKRKERCSYEQ
jgi:hypothetical protein